MPPKSVSLAQLHVDFPCTRDWDAMPGEGPTRFCDACGKHVHDLSRMTTAEAERLVLEGRKYRRRPLSGEPRVRAELSLSGGETMVVYLPDAIASSLPLMTAFPVVALCAPRPREDVVETAEEALFVMALGRVLQARGGEEKA